MTDRRGHLAHLMIPAFGEFKSDPGIRHVLTKSDRRIAGSDIWLRVQDVCTSRQRGAPTDYHALFEFLKGRGIRDLFHLCPINSDMGIVRMKQSRIQFRLIAEQQQSFTFSVQPADWVNTLRKSKVRQCPVLRSGLRGELREHAVRFIERDEHEALLCHKFTEINTDKRS